MTRDVAHLIVELGDLSDRDGSLDETVHARAVRELVLLGSAVVPEIVEELERHLDSLDSAPFGRGQWQVAQSHAWGLAEALGEIGDDEAGAVLLRSLAHDGSVAIAAAEALRKVRNEHAVGPLIDLLARTVADGSFVGRVIETLLSYNPDVDQLITRYRNETIDAGRRNVLKAVAAHPDAPAEVFLDAMTDNDHWIHWVAIEGILACSRRREGDPSQVWIEALAYLALEDQLGARESRGVTWRAVEALDELCGFGDPDAMEPDGVSLAPAVYSQVVRVATDGESEFAPRVAQRLEDVASSTRGVELLLEMARYPHPADVRIYTLDLVERCGTGEGVRRLLVKARLALVASDTADVQRWAANGLPDRLEKIVRSSDGAGFLLGLVREPHAADLRIHMLDLVENHGETVYREFVTTCLDLLTDRDRDVRDHVTRIVLGTRLPWSLRWKYRKDLGAVRKA